MLVHVLDFLGAYYPRYMCVSCLSTLIVETEPAVEDSLAPRSGLDFATADCISCARRRRGARFKDG
jgi:hypothetical protein